MLTACPGVSNTGVNQSTDKVAPQTTHKAMSSEPHCSLRINQNSQQMHNYWLVAWLYWI